MPSYSQRAPFNDWWYWSECLVKRLRTLSDLYKENGEAERSNQAADWAKRLKDNCMPPIVLARKGVKTDEEKAELKRLEEEAIFNAANMFRELLVNLPFMSSAIQDFLGVKWDECKWPEPNEQQEVDEETGIVKKKKKRVTDQRVMELFWGPKARQDEGIRSGKVADGGLPGILANLVAAEKSSSNRTPTDYGQAMLAGAAQQSMATHQRYTGTGIQTNFKPGGSI